MQIKETKVERIRRESTNHSIDEFNADVAAGGLPKKRKNGRAKGKRGENAVAKLFAAWWSELEPGVEFRSTPSSGGWATPLLRGHFKVAGDLTTTAKKFCFTVEVKWREAWTMANVYAAKPSPVWKWWAQACKSAAEEGRVPILIFRKNSRSPEWFVLLPAAAVDSAIPRLDAWGVRVGLCDVFPPTRVRPVLTTWEGLTMFSPQAIIRMCREYVSPPASALGASQARPKPQPSKPPPKPRKARQRPAQAGASLPLDRKRRMTELIEKIAVRDRDLLMKLAESPDEQLQAIGEHLATPPKRRRPKA